MLQKSYICVTSEDAIENECIIWYILITGCDISFCIMINTKEIIKMRVKEKNGITLIALVVTIIVLLILARNIYKYVNRTKWNIK